MQAADYSETDMIVAMSYGSILCTIIYVSISKSYIYAINQTVPNWNLLMLPLLQNAKTVLQFGQYDDIDQIPALEFVCARTAAFESILK